MVDTKNLIFAALVAYLVLDLCMTLLLKNSRPMLFAGVRSAFKKERRRVLIGLALAIATGAGVYHLLSQDS